MITKQGVSIWSTEPPAAGYRFDDVSAAVAAEVGEVPTVDGVDGSGRVLTYTVNADTEGPRRAIAVVVLGGLLSSTFLNLFVIPAGYALAFRSRLSPSLKA